MWLWGLMTASGNVPGRLHGAASDLDLAVLADVSTLRGRLEELRGKSVLLTGRDQVAAAAALVELDGVARRLVLCTPDLAPDHLPRIVQDAEIDAWVGDTDRSPGPQVGLGITPGAPVSGGVVRRRSLETEWVLLTSGTTGAPKLVLHTAAGLTSAFAGRPPPAEEVVWGTFYDVRRYGGLQILLRALHAGSLVLSSPGETVPGFLARVGRAGVTHISGTPSHWRKALMSGAASLIDPQYVRLSGEIADQAILDGLQAAFPRAMVAHAFASTEAGVGFEVRDGHAGFPADLAAASGGGAEIDVSHGTLRLRSAGNALRYLGADAATLRAADGFVDTGDQLELREGRYYFVGRSGGVINVGGQKVHPEEIEAVINSHPAVHMSRVSARRNAITGSLVVAEVVLAHGIGSQLQPETEVGRGILELCRGSLVPYKVPAVIRIVPSLEVSPSGKLVRANA